MMESKSTRYQSRILREMKRNSENPFNSPPSSTGSHGTVTLTSDISYAGDESIHLPAFGDRHSKAHQGTPFKVNTSALGRNFPEWKGWNSREQTEDIYGTTSDHIADGAKENVPPSSSTAASPTNEVKSQSQRHFKVGGGGSIRTRAQMQPRVETESDADAHTPRQQSKTSAPMSNPRRRNVSILIDTLKAAQAKEAEAKNSPPRPSLSERRSSPRSRISNVHMSPGTPNQTARSFFLPNLVHINDFVAGDLKLSTKNGVPIFIKDGKVHDRESRRSSEMYAEVDAFDLPEDEKKIFVSLDNIREEIQTLQEHDDQVTRQAEHLQEEVYELQVQMSKMKSRKDSAMGSDSDSSTIDQLNNQKLELEEQVASLQSRLDKANRKISINEIHTESYVTERDEALKTSDAHLEKIHRLHSELDAAQRELSVARASGNNQDLSAVEVENRSLREDNMAIRQQYKSMLDENQSLRSHSTAVAQENVELKQEIKRLQRLLDTTQGDNEQLQKEYEIFIEEKRTLRQDNVSLERHNDKYYTENKSLQQRNSLLERQVQDLKDNNNQLHQMIDVANVETGTTTFDVKDIKNRLEKKNRDLSEENAQLQQQILDLQAEISSMRIASEQEKRRLVSSNDRLHDQIDLISKQFEQIVREGRERAVQYVEKQAGLTQQLQESNFQAKPVKVTRIIEPSTSMKGRTMITEVSARSTTTPTDFELQDDYTQQIDLTQGSDFGSIFPKEGTERLRDALRRARTETHQKQTEDVIVEEAAITDDISLPPAFLSRLQRTDGVSTKSSAVASRGQSEMSKGQPLGILKNAHHARQATEQDLTGRFSVKSAISGISLPSQTGRSDVSHGRRHSDSARFDLDVEDNMTSAFFMDDITLESRKRAAQMQKTTKAIPTLSRDAKRVLDSLCVDHDCRNCFVCVRINSHKHEDDMTSDGANKKTTVRVEKPIPVTDRVPNPVSAVGSDYEDQPTMRPSQDPGVALATVLKGLQDEAAHIKSRLAEKQAKLSALDPSFGRRQRKQLTSEINHLMRMLDLKWDQIYALNDVLEGQKTSGQLMTEQEVEITVASIMSKDHTWDGIMD